MKTNSVRITLSLSFLFVCFFTSISANCQQFKVTQSQETDYEDAPNSFISYNNALYSAEIIDKRRQLAYTAKLDKLKFGIRLHKFSGSFSPIKEVKLFDGDRKFGPLDPMMRVINNKPYLLYYLFANDGEESNFSLMAAAIDTNSLQLSAPKEIFNVDMKNIGVIKMIDLLTDNLFRLSYSADSSKLAFVWTTGINEEIYVTVTDRNLEKTWSKKETFTHSKKFDLISSAVDNSGIVYASFHMEVKKEYETFLAVIQQNKKLLEKDVRLNLAYSYEAHLIPVNGGKNMLLAGTYGLSEEHALTGVYSAPISATNFNVGKETLMPFPENIVLQLDKEGWASTKKKNYGIERLNLAPVSLQDGSFSLTGHFSRIRHGQKSTFRESGSILIAHLGKSKPAFTVVPKARVSAGSAIGDFIFPFAAGNSTIVLYNDSEKNFNKALEEESSRADVYKNFMLVAAVVNSDGTAKKLKVLDLSEGDFLSQPENALRNPDGTILIPFRKIKGMGGLADKMKFATIKL
jgi:hypothetical protein